MQRTEAVRKQLHVLMRQINDIEKDLLVAYSAVEPETEMSKSLLVCWDRIASRVSSLSVITSGIRSATRVRAGNRV